MNYTIEIIVNASLDDVWTAWTNPADIRAWNFASTDWHCPEAEIALNIGSKFSYRMEAKDQSFGFDFEGRFTEIIEKEKIVYVLEDMREVKITFAQTTDGIHLKESFDAEDENSGEKQKQGWQAILDNFKKHVEALD